MDNLRDKGTNIVMLRRLLHSLSIILVGFIYVQECTAFDIASKREAINASVVGVLGGSPSGTYIKLVHDLALLLDDGYEMRILPTTGKGSVRAVEDLMYLRGIDIALIQSDVLDFYRLAKVFPNLDDRIRYITKLYNEEFHLLARGGFTSIFDLAGQKVNFGSKSSGTHLTSKLVFDQLGIEVEILSDDHSIALGKLKRGEIDAMVQIAGKPASLVKDLPEASGLTLLSVPSTRIRGSYLPSSFVTTDYPNFIEPGRSVETIAVGAVMAVYNWPAGHPRHHNIKRFVKLLYANFDRLVDPPFHPKWREVSLEAELPGWTRF